MVFHLKLPNEKTPISLLVPKLNIFLKKYCSYCRFSFFSSKQNSSFILISVLKIFFFFIFNLKRNYLVNLLLLKQYYSTLHIKSFIFSFSMHHSQITYDNSSISVSFNDFFFFFFKYLFWFLKIRYIHYIIGVLFLRHLNLITQAIYNFRKI